MQKQKTNQDGNRCIENGRLVYYYKKADQDFWEDVWEQNWKSDYYKPFLSGYLSYFRKIFTRHLPRSGRILEAGCGTAQWVVALEANGYNCVGLDYAFDALRASRQVVDDLKLIAGDLTALGISNEAFDAIISIGVVEHRRDGPDEFLSEMHRILKPDGMMLISVPYFNPLRKWRARRGAYQDDVGDLDFYQYAFSREEFCSILEAAGFHVEVTYAYAHKHALSQELKWLKKIHPFLRKNILRVSKYTPYVNSELGHMLMAAACKKPVK